MSALQVGALVAATLWAATVAHPSLAQQPSGASRPVATDAVPVPEPRPAQPGEASARAAETGKNGPASPPDKNEPAGRDPLRTSGGEKEPGRKPTPDELRTGHPEITPELSVEAAAAVADAKLCEAELSRRGARFTVGESISEGDCGVLRPVELTTLSNGTAVEPGTKLLCRSALALDHWIADAVEAEGRERLGAKKLTTLRQASTYVCRARASESKISEHARGSAIDIASFVFDAGKEVGVVEQSPGSPEAAFQAAVRTKACGPFKTVLGPGTDADHATHLHLDIAARRNGATYCK